MLDNKYLACYIIHKVLIKECDFLKGTKYWNNFHDHVFFRILKFPAICSLLNRWEKGREISKPGKNRGLGSKSNISFPLD